jgi:hypothetical protein
MKTLALLTPALFLTAAAGAADLRYDLANDAADRSALSVLNTSAANLKLGVQLQFRYDVNLRDDDALGDDDTTIGFSMRRAKVEGSGSITDSMKGKFVFAFDRSSGDAVLEDALVDWEINDTLSASIGQFKLPFLREESISSKRQLFHERSSANETFNQDRAQGAQLNLGGDAWRAAVAFSDGFNSDNTSFNSDDEADYALTARAEFKFGDADWKAYDQFTSFRGAASGGMIGAAAHWQSAGDTNPSLPDNAEMLGFTADASYMADGWNLFGSVVWMNEDDGADDFDDVGVVVQGGLFFTDQLEGIARWSAVFPDSNRANDQDYSDVALGMNYYIVPESHAAKFTAAVVYAFDATNDSIVATSNGHNLFASDEDGQIGLTFQLQLLF